MPHDQPTPTLGPFVTHAQRAAMLDLLPTLIAQSEELGARDALAVAVQLRELLEQAAPVPTRTLLELCIDLDEQKARYFRAQQQRARGPRRRLLRFCEDHARAYATEHRALLAAVEGGGG